MIAPSLINISERVQNHSNFINSQRSFYLFMFEYFSCYKSIKKNKRIKHHENQTTASLHSKRKVAKALKLFNKMFVELQKALNI